VFQRYISITFAREFVRKYAGGVWSEWQERPMTADIATEVARAQAAEADKVDKVEGKQLSTEDYTTEEKEKLANLSEDGGGDGEVIFWSVGYWGNTQPAGNYWRFSNESDIPLFKEALLAGKKIRLCYDSKSVWLASRGTNYSAKTQPEALIRGIDDGNGSFKVILLEGTRHEYNSVLYQGTATSFSAGSAITTSTNVLYTNEAKDIPSTLVRVSSISRTGTTLNSVTITGTTLSAIYLRLPCRLPPIANYALDNAWLFIKGDSGVVSPIGLSCFVKGVYYTGSATFADTATSVTIPMSPLFATTAQLADKVDKVDGKGLSTEDYTTAEKEKLAGLENGGTGGAIPDALRFRGEWASGTTYAKGDMVRQTNGVYINYYVSLEDGNTATYNTAAKWESLNRYAATAANITVTTSNATKRYLVGSSGLDVANTSIQGRGTVYVGEDNHIYDARGKLAAQSEIPSGGGTGGNYLPLAGGEITGDVTLKYPAKLIGSGNGQTAADWLKYDNSSNYFTIGNTGTVPEIASAASYVYRKNSSGTRYKIYDEGNKPTPAAIGAASTAEITETARLNRYETIDGATRNITTAGQTVSASIGTAYAKVILALSNNAQSEVVFTEIILRSDSFPSSVFVPGIGGFFASESNPLNLSIKATRTSQTTVQFTFNTVTYSGANAVPNFVLTGIMAIK
jgi:hypothetical protein